MGPGDRRFDAAERKRVGHRLLHCHVYDDRMPEQHRNIIYSMQPQSLKAYVDGDRKIFGSFRDIDCRFDVLHCI